MMEAQDYRLDLLNKLRTISHKLCITADKLTGNPSQDGISVEELETFPYNKWIKIGEGVEVRKRKKRFDTMLSFDCRMNKGGVFSEHFHTDAIESVDVISGEMIDASENDRVYDEGDVAHWGRGVKHTPTATKKTFLHVLFKVTD